ncbi:Response regulator protein TmoT [Pandoraea aquatica]|uniref:Response regulator protein TmoT n=1 Tax=Pandoraea aquatica TaxID=2508290 RepID=A0A5E4SB22_9BURK|nr:response regulator [Pandoraea aquatica]VVD72341.1 Response regulator protein TmoT [Pandoraea aquatica]
MTKSRKIIVILEDDTGMRRAVERLLTISGYRTRAFSSAGEDGVAESIRAAYCVVADVNLPGLSGPAFYQTLPSPRPPVVFVTAYDNEAARAEIRQSGGQELLPKPFLGNDLLSAIERAARSQP